MLEKIIPVINGLLVASKENRDQILRNGQHMKALMDVFRYQIPIEIHENALYASFNLLQDCNKAQKMQLLSFGLLKSIMKFLADLYEIENEILQSNDPENKDFMTVFIDYELQWNPKFSSTKMKRDKDLTLDEM